MAGSIIHLLLKQRMESKPDNLWDKGFHTIGYANIIWDCQISILSKS
jgi:hypothetical protein